MATAAQDAKSAGLKSLTQVSGLSGVGLTTLINWHRDKPNLFKIVLFGCLYKLQMESDNDRGSNKANKTVLPVQASQD